MDLYAIGVSSMTSASLRHSTPAVAFAWSSSVKRRFPSGMKRSLHRHHAAADVHADRCGNDRAPCGNHAAHSSADTPMHIGHRRHPLVDEGQLRNVQKLLTCSIFQRDSLGPGIDRCVVFGLDYVVSVIVSSLLR